MGPFAGQALSTITLDDLRRLVTNAVPESLHLDYKRELKLDDKDEKKEFLRDLTALANSEGGTIIYGVDEERDADGKPTGVPKGVEGFAISNRDAFVLAVEHIIKDGIDERLPSFQLATVPVADDKHVLMIRVPQSLRAPHMVILGGERRFFFRGNSGRQEMSTAQIRDTVLRSATATERIQHFVQQRMLKCRKLINNSRPLWALHVIPLVADPAALDVTDQQVIRRLQRVSTPHGGTTAHCVEGLKVADRSPDGCASHTIIFRDGTVEFVEQEVFWHGDAQTKYLACGVFDRHLFELLDGVLKLYEEGLVQFPAVVCVTLDRVSGYAMAPGRGHRFRQPPPVAEEVLEADPLLVLNLPASPSEVLKPVLDFIWNAFGLPRCEGYDGSGKYVGYP